MLGKQSSSHKLHGILKEHHQRSFTISLVGDVAEAEDEGREDEIAEEEVQRSSAEENLGISMSSILIVFFLFAFLAIFIPASAQKNFITALMHRHFFCKIEAESKVQK